MYTYIYTSNIYTYVICIHMYIHIYTYTILIKKLNNTPGLEKGDFFLEGIWEKNTEHF